MWLHRLSRTNVEEIREEMPYCRFGLDTLNFEFWNGRLFKEVAHLYEGQAIGENGLTDKNYYRAGSIYADEDCDWAVLD
jgi:hypothetical protein